MIIANTVLFHPLVSSSHVALARLPLRFSVLTFQGTPSPKCLLVREKMFVGRMELRCYSHGRRTATQNLRRKQPPSYAPNTP